MIIHYGEQIPSPHDIVDMSHRLYIQQLCLSTGMCSNVGEVGSVIIDTRYDGFLSEYCDLQVVCAECPEVGRFRVQLDPNEAEIIMRLMLDMDGYKGI